MSEIGGGMSAVLVILSAVIYGVCPSLVKLTYALGGSGPLAVCYTSAIALPLLLLWAKGGGVDLRPARGEGMPLLLLALSTGVTSVLLYSSYQFIPVGLATALHFIYPAASALYLRLFCGARFHALHRASLLCAAAGAACMASSAAGSANLAGVALAVASGFTWAFYIVYLDRSGLCRMPPAKLNFYTALANALCSGAMCLAAGAFTAFGAAWPWLLLVLVALAHRLCANVFFQIGVRGVSAFSASIYSTFEPLTSMAMGTLLLGERLTPPEALGFALILLAVLCNVLANAPAGRRSAAH